MKEKKTDQRSRFTQMMIKKSLLKLLAKKPLNKITVAELCADAGANRITFYNHFHDIYHVYETIEDDFFEEIMSKLGNMKTYDIERSMISEIVLFLYRNSEMCTLIINAKSGFIPRIMEAFRPKFISELSARHPDIPHKILDALYIFQVNGNLGLVVDWIQQGLKAPPEEIINSIVTFNRFTLLGMSRHYAEG